VDYSNASCCQQSHKVRLSSFLCKIQHVLDVFFWVCPGAAGDMRPNPAFEELAKDADLVILQVSEGEVSQV
jgi:hypothetical protein